MFQLSTIIKKKLELEIKELVGELSKKAVKLFAWGLIFSIISVAVIFMFLKEAFFDVLPGLILITAIVSIIASLSFMILWGFNFHVEKEKRSGEIFQS